MQFNIFLLYKLRVSLCKSNKLFIVNNTLINIKYLCRKTTYQCNCYLRVTIFKQSNTNERLFTQLRVCCEQQSKVNTLFPIVCITFLAKYWLRTSEYEHIFFKYLIQNCLTIFSLIFYLNIIS